MTPKLQTTPWHLFWIKRTVRAGKTCKELHPVFTIISFSWPLYWLLFQSEQKLSESVSHLKNPFITVTLLIHFCDPFVAVTRIYYVVEVMLLQKRNEFHEEGKLLLTYTSYGHVFLIVCCSDELQRGEYVSQDFTKYGFWGLKSGNI